MTLVKSKINSLAWLKTAIYLSVVGGVILSSKPASARLTFDGEQAGTYVITRNFGGFPSQLDITGNNWIGEVIINEAPVESDDYLAISGYFQHINSPHHVSPSQVFNFGLSLNASDAKDQNTNNVTDTITNLLNHENHSDSFRATLTAVTRIPRPSEHHIVSWTFNLEGRHRTEPVPEPTTIFGSALALGVGGWLKRKKSGQENKTTSQN